MPWSEALNPWLIHSAIASLLILAIGSGAVLLCRRPARRVWMIELILAELYHQFCTLPRKRGKYLVF